MFLLKKIIAAALAASALTACLVEGSSGSGLAGLDMSGGNDVHGLDGTGAADVSASDEAETASAPEEEETSPPADIKGDICDVRGNVLVYSSYEGDTSARYFSSGYKLSFANILGESSAGLDTVLDGQLRRLNPTPVQGHSNVGRSVRLTIDGDVQNAVFSYMQNNNLAGSVVGMRTDGSLMAEVS